MLATALHPSIACDIIPGMAEGSAKSNFALRLPSDLLDELRARAERQNTSVNTLMVALLAGGVGFGQGNDPPFPRLSPDQCRAAAATLRHAAPGGEVRRRIVAELERVARAGDYGDPNIGLSREARR